MIHRNAFAELEQWKVSSHRKPLLLQGARQVGKTWLMEYFGRTCFTYMARFDFNSMPGLCDVFERNRDISSLLKELALYTDVPLEAGRTLLVFDEIQACDGALNSLKYFCEDAPGFHVIAAGSLLGVEVRRKRMQVPVGKVRIMRLYPVSFREFLRESDERTWHYVEELESVSPLPPLIMQRLQLAYRQYMVSGGMPEAVSALLGGQGMGQVEQVLQDILDMYELDFSKYADPVHITRIHHLWHSLPSQLAKENRKFLYRMVRPGARSREYEDGLLWLEEAGLIHRVFHLSKPGLPISAYRDVSAFKVYSGDVGLLRRLSRLSPEAVLGENANYTEFRGALAENGALLALIPQCYDMPAYWTSGNQAEVDFIAPFGTEVIPVEVKADRRTAGKSLSVYHQKYQPSIRIRYSMNNLFASEGLLACPLPLADWTQTLLSHLSGRHGVTVSE